MTEEEGKKRSFRFTSKQQRFMSSEADRLLYSGSVNAGKTFVGCAKAYMLSLRYPGNRGLVIRKDFTSLRETTLLTLLEGDPETDAVVPEDNIISHNRTEHRIELATGGEPSTIIYSGLDTTQKGGDYPTEVGSSQYGWIFVDEAVELKREDWLFLESRLRHPVGIKQIFAATNPAAPTHWLYDMFIRSGGEGSEVIQANIYDNPLVDPDYIRRLESAYSGTMKERLLKGKWTAAEGLVYSNFDMDIHVKEVGREQEFKSIIVGADSGFTNPRALLIIGKTGGDKYYVLDEFYRTRTDVSVAVEWLRNWEERSGRRVDSIYHDPSEPAEIEKFRDMGYRCIEKADNDVIAGVSEVNKVLGNFEEEDERKEPRLFIDPSCKNLIEEFGSYRYPHGESEKPVKKDDHLMDSLRYAVMGGRSCYREDRNRFEIIHR